MTTKDKAAYIFGYYLDDLNSTYISHFITNLDQSGKLYKIYEKCGGLPLGVGDYIFNKEQILLIGLIYNILKNENTSLVR